MNVVVSARAKPARRARPLARRAVGLLRAIWVPLVLCALVAVLSFSLGGGNGSLHQTVLSGLINLIVVVGLYIFIGNSGVLSFGHISFMALGAYTSALMTVPVVLKHTLLPNLPHFLAAAQFGSVVGALIGGAVAMVFAAIVAAPLMRLTGLAAAIATFAVLIVVNVVTGNWTSLTRGQETMLGVPLDLTVVEVVVAACVAIFVAYAFQRSRIGYRLRATREDEVAARSIGIGVVWGRSVAFVISAFVVGVAGAFYAHYLGSFGADAFYIDITFLTLAMLVIGGINSLTGAVIGSLVITALVAVLTQLERGATVIAVHVTLPHGSDQIVLAVFMLAVLIGRPKGLTAGRELPWPSGLPRRLRRRRRASAAAP